MGPAKKGKVVQNPQVFMFFENVLIQPPNPPFALLENVLCIVMP